MNKFGKYYKNVKWIKFFTVVCKKIVRDQQGNFSGSKQQIFFTYCIVGELFHRNIMS
jgi:hypothetical protein